MKYLLIVYIIFFENVNGFAGDLKCSANGTVAYHIPGAFTSQQDQVLKGGAKDKINTILTTNQTLLTLKNKYQT